MTTLTHTQIADAKNNDLDAVSSVIRETEDLVIGRARRFATTNGHTDTDLSEDLAQVGRITVWEAISAFTGEDPAQFIAHADRSITRAMEDARREATRPGVSVFTAKRFETAIALAGGDPYEAERIAASEDRGDEKLTPELARAARLSWLGFDSLDRPFNVAITGKHITLGDVIAAEMEEPADLLDSRDIAAYRRRVICDQVHRALGKLSDRQRHVVKAAYGITPAPLYRAGEDDDELAADMDVTPYQVQQARTKGQKRFSELYRAGACAW
ncbi:sigma-70 family RNA polymerase sigma factor [Streptomyces tsukubensis]|uniref:sigma-70 family RNA polymerase sigma factor n=1 Tax=Streptomyces tsukubensis TaxID=83656 RepID=UPI0036A44DBC